MHFENLNLAANRWLQISSPFEQKISQESNTMSVYDCIHHRIAIVDDDQNQRSQLSSIFANDNFPTMGFHSSEQFLRALPHDVFDLVIVDLLMPRISGIEILTHIRDVRPEIPVIIMSSINDDDKIASALQIGADDFIIKPVSDLVLRAKIDSVFRRIRPVAEEPSAKFVMGPFEFDRANFSVNLRGNHVSQTNREFNLAMLFFSNPHRTLSRAFLLECLQGKISNYESRTLDTHIARIRSKLCLGSGTGINIQMIYGLGYRLKTM